IQHELDTYNELLGGEGELGATLLIEIEDPVRRDLLLRRWTDLPRGMYVRLEDGRRIRARADERQISTDRLSSVQYLKFPTGGAGDVAAAARVVQEPPPPAPAPQTPPPVRAGRVDRRAQVAAKPPADEEVKPEEAAPLVDPDRPPRAATSTPEESRVPDGPPL